MNRKKLPNILIVGCFATFLFLFLATIPGNQQKVLTSQQSSKLLALVGQKCQLILNNGTRVSGTLWDFDDVSLTVKVKKGLLYSTTEHHQIADIVHFEDVAGNKIYFNATQNNPKDNKKPTTLFFSMDDTETTTVKSEQKAADITDEEAAMEHTPTFLNQIEESAGTSELNRKPALNSNSGNFLQQSKRATHNTQLSSLQYDNTGKEQTTKVPQHNSHKSLVATYSLVQNNNEMAKARRVGPAKSIAGKKKITQNTKKPRNQRNKQQKTAGNKLAVETKKLRTLRYQTLILFGAVFLIALIMIFSRIFGMGSSAYARSSMFPSKLVKMNGRYGIVDQGMEDGVKVDDIIRLYHKVGKKIVYHGMVQVKKVGENYSAVEVIKKQRGVRLNVGDVGFRDRNFIATSFKRLRIWTSHGLASLGKGILLTAKGLEINEEEPTISLGMDQDQETDEAQEKAEKKIKNKTRKTSQQKIIVTKRG